MFAAVDPTRAWPATGMTTARWLHVPPVRVELGDLTATQDSIYLAPLLEQEPSSHCGDPLPHVVVWNGRTYLEDGHHRAIRAAINGQRHIDARVLVLAYAEPSGLPRGEADVTCTVTRRAGQLLAQDRGVTYSLSCGGDACPDSGT